MPPKSKFDLQYDVDKSNTLPKSKFDLQYEEQPQKNSPGIDYNSLAQKGLEGTMAFGQGAGQFLTAGNMPRLSGLLGSIVPNPSATQNQELRAQGFNVIDPSEQQTYLNARDEEIRRERTSQAEHPYAYLAGQATGLIGSAAPIGALSKVLPGANAAGAGGRILNAASTGGVAGLLQNPGDTEGQPSGLQAKERLQNAAISSGLGGALQGAGELVGNKLQKFANTRSASALGLTSGEAKQMAKNDPTGMEGWSAEQLGKWALDKGIVKAGDDAKTIADKAAAYRDNIGKRMGQIYDDAEEHLGNIQVSSRLSPDAQEAINSTNFNRESMANEFWKEAQDKYIGEIDGSKTLNSIKKQLSNLNAPEEKEMSITELQDWKKNLDKKIWEDGRQLKNTDGLRSLRDYLKGKMDDRILAIDNVFGNTLGGDLKSLNQEYSKASTASRLSSNMYAKQIGNNFGSIRDSMAGTLGAGAGAVEGYREGGLEGALKGAVIGGSLGAVSKLGRTYGRSAMASGSNAAAKSVRNPAVSAYIGSLPARIGR